MVDVDDDLVASAEKNARWFGNDDPDRSTTGLHKETDDFNNNSVLETGGEIVKVVLAERDDGDEDSEARMRPRPLPH